MSIQKRLAITLVTLLASVAFAGAAVAQAGAACGVPGALTCGLGGQIRGQIGDGLPLPISIGPGYTGAFVGGTSAGGHNNAEIHTPTVFTTTMDGTETNTNYAHSDEFGDIAFPGEQIGKGLGQHGRIKPTASATLMHTTMAVAGRGITQGAGNFGYGPTAQGSIGVVNFNNEVFAVQTNLIFDSPHPGTTGTTLKGGSSMVVTTMGVVSGPTSMNYPATRMFSAGGRPGPATVTYYPGAAGALSTNYGNGVPPTTPIVTFDPGSFNGIARFTKTANQFGGTSTGRTLGTAKVYFNDIGLNPALALPCTGTSMCQFGLSTVIPGTAGVAGGTFAGSTTNDAFSTPTGVFTGTIGFNGTIINQGAAVTGAGSPLPFTGQGATSVGFPVTTGRLSITVTDVATNADTEMWKRTGVDARDAGGNGVIALVTGSLSTRSISKANANRTWTTLEIPEPSAIFAASAGLFALFGCHQLVRRRNR